MYDSGSGAESKKTYSNSSTGKKTYTNTNTTPKKNTTATNITNKQKTSLPKTDTGSLKTSLGNTQNDKSKGTATAPKRTTPKIGGDYGKTGTVTKDSYKYKSGKPEDSKVQTLGTKPGGLGSLSTSGTSTKTGQTQAGSIVSGHGKLKPTGKDSKDVDLGKNKFGHLAAEKKDTGTDKKSNIPQIVDKPGKLTQNKGKGQQTGKVLSQSETDKKLSQPGDSKKKDGSTSTIGSKPGGDGKTKELAGAKGNDAASGKVGSTKSLSSDKGKQNLKGTSSLRMVDPTCDGCKANEVLDLPPGSATVTRTPDGKG